MVKLPSFFAYPSYKFAVEIPGRGWMGVQSMSALTKQSVQVPQPPDPITGKPQPAVDKEVVMPVTLEGGILDMRDGSEVPRYLTAGDVFLAGFKDKHEVVVVHALDIEEGQEEATELRRYTLTKCKVLSYTLARHAAAEDGLATEVVVLQPEDFTMQSVDRDEILTGDGEEGED